MTRRIFFILLAYCLSLLPAAVNASELAPGDFDGDSKSDLSEARVNRRTGTTQWNVRTADGSVKSFQFGAAADGFVTGRFVQDKRVTPGIVSAHNNRPLEWRIKTPDGGEAYLQFGFDGDILPNLGDLDCDGITDISVVRNNGRADLPGQKVWYTALSASATVVETVFGNIFDRAFTADTDGDNCDEMVVLREGFHWFSSSVGSANVKVVQWGLPGDIPLMPFDVNNDGTPDYAVVRPTLGGQFAYVRYGAQAMEVFALGPDSSVPLGGRFDDDTFFAYVNRSAGTAQFAGDVGTFGFASPVSALIRPDGVSIDSDENGRFFRAGDSGVVSAIRGHDDFIGYGCSTPKIPDGKNKKRAWQASGGGIVPRYYLLGIAREIEVFSVNGKLIDRFDVIKPGGKNKRELWQGNLSTETLALHAPLLLKETGVNGYCTWIDIANPHINWD